MDTGEPGAVISRMPGSVGGRRKRVRITRIPRRRPTLHDLTADQRQSLATIRTTNTALYRAYLLKEQLRAVFATKGRRGEQLLGGWIAWARRSRLHEFVALARTIKRFQQLIWNTLHKHGVSNARSEATGPYPLRWTPDEIAAVPEHRRLTDGFDPKVLHR